MSVSEAELRWKCRRGMLELDLLLTGFVERQYAELDDAVLDQLVQLLDYPDQVLQDLLVNGAPSADQKLTKVINLIRDTQQRSIAQTDS